MSALSSPALSFCDSFSSPDLDAYLDSLSPLSQLPSPTMKEAWWREDTLHGRHDSSVSDISPPLTIAAGILCNITACESCNSIKPLQSMITQFLSNSRVPMETVALAYNILSQPTVAAMHCWHSNPVAFASGHMQSKILEMHGPESDASCQRALVILSALSVAVSFTEDQPRNLFHWSRQVAGGIFSTEQISTMNRIVLAKLEWSIHPLTAPVAIEAALTTLSGSGVVAHSKQSSLTPFIVDEDALKLILGPQTTVQHGLITPEPSPDCMHADDDHILQYLAATPAQQSI